MSPYISRRRLIVSVGAACAVGTVWAEEPTVSLLNSPSTSELRGLGCAGDAVWTSGTAGNVVLGTVARGLSLTSPPGSDFDFRGLQAFSSSTALVMAAGPGAASALFLTKDAGRTWGKVAENRKSDGFWDAVSFADRARGLVLGDPVGGAFELIGTSDGGETWSAIVPKSLPTVRTGESAFAASNGCLAHGPSGQVAFCTGGNGAWGRVFLSRDHAESFQVYDTPIAATSESSGAFALTFDQSGALWVCGGDYRQPTSPQTNLARLVPGGDSFERVDCPTGYLSSVAISGRTVIAAGTSGIIVGDAKAGFIKVSSAPFNTVRFVSPKLAVLVGPKGTIASIKLS